MSIAFFKRQRRAPALRRAVIALAAPALAAASCTNDFSDFDVGGAGLSDGGAPSSGGSDAGGTPNDGSVSSGGGGGLGGTGGAIGGGGATSGGSAGSGGASGGSNSGGASGGSSTGGAGTGGAATGGSTSGGAAGSGGRAGSGGASGSGGGGGAAGAGGAPDAGTSCDAIFGAVPGYLLCMENANICRFVHAEATASTCDAICSTYGSACVGAANCDPGSCTVTGTAMCNTSFASQICVCSKR